MSEKKIISTFQPFDFKNQFIDFAPHQEILKGSVNDFFIHALHHKNIKLRLPFPPQRKTVNDFLFVTNGYVKRQLGIVNYDVRQNELMIIPKFQISTTEFHSEDLNGFYCHFSDSFLTNNPFLLQWKPTDFENTKVVLSQETANRIHQLLETINNLYQQNWIQNKELIAQYLRTVLTEITFQNKYVPSVLDKKKGLVLKYIQLVNINLKKGLKISNYAELLHISPNHLNKIIKNQLSKSAQEIHNEIILQEAKVLLLQTSKDISEIAFDLGFNDVSYFGKFFRKHTNQSPMEYRKMIEKYQ